MHLQLVANQPETAHLRLAESAESTAPRQLAEQVRELLADGRVLTRGKLRDRLRVKNERLGETLEHLEQSGQLRRTPSGWQRAD